MVHTPDLVHYFPLPVSITKGLRTEKKLNVLNGGTGTLRSPTTLCLSFETFQVGGSKPGCISRKDTPSVQDQTSLIPDHVGGTRRDMI
jgi:hypothetical protein